MYEIDILFVSSTQDKKLYKHYISCFYLVNILMNVPNVLYYFYNTGLIFFNFL